jgi:hypothetical protein
MPLPIRNLHTVEEFSSYIAEFNVDIPLRTATPSLAQDPLLVRGNIYRPKDGGIYPVLVTYGPCESAAHYYGAVLTISTDGKDISYAE